MQGNLSIERMCQLAGVIPWRVALQQSPPPLRQQKTILAEKRLFEQEKSLNGGCANSRLSQRRGSPQACVPNVCRLGKTRPNSSTLSRSKDRSKTLIQRTLREHSRPLTTSAKDGKNGFVISRSPVRSRRVAPSIWSEINQLLTIGKLTMRLNCVELAHKPAHRGFGCGGASGAKLLENTPNRGTFEVPARVSNE
jgi:hypothetical protein